MAATIVIGLGYGDEGKGMSVLCETNRYKRMGMPTLNVRFNGGPQAAHNVRLVRDGVMLHHTHSQFGSGTLLGARTVITDGMLFDPIRLEPEACHLYDLMGENVMDRLYVDGSCNVIFPAHVVVNRMIERERGASRHGSTGSGIGVARNCQDHGLGIELRDVVDGTARGKLRLVMEHIGSEFGTLGAFDDGDLVTFCERVENCVRTLMSYGMHVVDDAAGMVHDEIESGTGVVFEGSQGILLDERYGSFPYVTYGDMTPDKALAIAPDACVVGVTRTYATRHGNGPLQYDGACDIPEADNAETEWAGRFRTALMSMDVLRRAADAVVPRRIDVSHVDRYPGAYYDLSGHKRQVGIEAFMDALERACAAQIITVGEGPTLDDWHRL